MKNNIFLVFSFASIFMVSFEKDPIASFSSYKESNE